MSDLNITNVKFAFSLAELWSDFLEAHEQMEPHLGGTVAELEDETHEPTMLEFMDWVVDQLEAIEPQLAEAESAAPSADRPYCSCPPGVKYAYVHDHNPRRLT